MLALHHLIWSISVSPAGHHQGMTLVDGMTAVAAVAAVACCRLYRHCGGGLARLPQPQLAWLSCLLCAWHACSPSSRRRRG